MTDDTISLKLSLPLPFCSSLILGAGALILLHVLPWFTSPESELYRSKAVSRRA
jgi:hypothetical protein